MNRRDLLASLFWLGVSIFVCIEAVESEIGTFHTPGPGFLPFLSGLFLGILAMILFIRATLQKGRPKIADLWKDLQWSKLIWVSFSLFLFCLLLPILGYLITTFGLMVFLLCMIEQKRVWAQGVSALLIALVSYIVFYILLDVRFPKGIFGF